MISREEMDGRGGGGEGGTFRRMADSETQPVVERGLGRRRELRELATHYFALGGERETKDEIKNVIQRNRISAPTSLDEAFSTTGREKGTTSYKYFDALFTNLSGHVHDKTW